jgi:hypothetical protein
MTDESKSLASAVELAWVWPGGTPRAFAVGFVVDRLQQSGGLGLFK